MIKKKTCWIPIIFGVLLIAIGLLFPKPGEALTTYSYLKGESTDGYYVLGKTFSAIDEYVGGDAYNYIIGASLVAGKISGAMTVKAIFIVGGLLCLCAGITMLTMVDDRNELSTKKESINAPITEEPKENSSPECVTTAVDSNVVENSEPEIHN